MKVSAQEDAFAVLEESRFWNVEGVDLQGRTIVKILSGNLPVSQVEKPHLKAFIHCKVHELLDSLLESSQGYRPFPHQEFSLLEASCSDISGTVHVTVSRSGIANARPELDTESIPRVPEEDSGGIAAGLTDGSRKDIDSRSSPALESVIHLQGPQESRPAVQCSESEPCFRRFSVLPEDSASEHHQADSDAVEIIAPASDADSSGIGTPFIGENLRQQDLPREVLEPGLGPEQSFGNKLGLPLGAATAVDDAFAGRVTILYISTASTSSEKSPGVLWLHQMYQELPEVAKSAIGAVYVLHPDLTSRFWLWAHAYCSSDGLYKKIVWLDRLEFLSDFIDENQVDIPDFVLTHDLELESRPLMDYGIEVDEVQARQHLPLGCDINCEIPEDADIETVTYGK